MNFLGNVRSEYGRELSNDGCQCPFSDQWKSFFKDTLTGVINYPIYCNWLINGALKCDVAWNYPTVKVIMLKRFIAQLNSVNRFLKPHKDHFGTSYDKSDFAGMNPYGQCQILHGFCKWFLTFVSNNFKILNDSLLKNRHFVTTVIHSHLFLPEQKRIDYTGNDYKGTSGKVQVRI